ncbi:hypothetical protein [Methanobrevibacter oralis]|uniref:Uncharacterized protein n=2 Tax=Methanobrevibacter oralis TaxID=66851 RepID=A0A166BZS7_METOA|nr:hypothetical protein [Methanobrevibacter oralis]KZX13982.1 hypothetical protein MBORA_02220 [Methanobrevibacter oralis]
MNISDMLGDSFRYAISDYKKFLIFGIIVLLGNLYSVFQNWSLNGAILLIGSIVSLIFIFVVIGYLIAVKLRFSISYFF